MADWFVTGDDFAYLVDVLVTFFGYGVGLGGVLWALGAGVHVIWDFVRF